MKLSQFISILVFVIFTVQLTYAQSNKVIDYETGNGSPHSIKAFTCENGNIFLTFETRLSGSGISLHMIDTEGNSIRKTKLKERLGIVGFVETDSNFILLAYRDVQYYNRIAYVIVEVDKQLTKYKTKKLSTFFDENDVELNRGIFTHFHAFSIKNAFYFVAMQKKVQHVYIFENNELRHHEIDLSNYEQLISHRFKEYNYYDAEKTQTIFDNFADNKIYVAKDKITFLYNLDEGVLINGRMVNVKTTNVLQLDLNNNSYFNVEIPHTNDESQEVLFDDKVWQLGKNEKGLVLSIFNLSNQKKEATYFLNNDAHKPNFINNGQLFYREKGLVNESNYNELMQYIYARRQNTLKMNRCISIEKTPRNEYAVTLASVAVTKDFNLFWNNQNNMNNIFWFNKFHRPPSNFFGHEPFEYNLEEGVLYASNNIENNKAFMLKDKLWAACLKINLDKDLKPASTTAEIKTSFSESLKNRQAVVKHVYDKYFTYSNKFSSTFELKHRDNTFVFFAYPREKNTLFIYKE